MQILSIQTTIQTSQAKHVQNKTILRRNFSQVGPFLSTFRSNFSFEGNHCRRQLEVGSKKNWDNHCKYLAEEGCLCRGGVWLDPEEASQTANLLRVCQQLLASVFCPSFPSSTVILGANIVHEVLVVQDKVLNRVGWSGPEMFRSWFLMCRRIFCCLPSARVTVVPNKRFGSINFNSWKWRFPL